MTIVSNTSPLINLARIGELDLLQELYETLIVPDAVWQEVVIDGAGLPGAAQVETSGWIKVQSVRNVQLVQALRQELDPGEAEAITLAVETNADLLLMDERLGRETARHLGIHYTGLIGTLIEAKQKGIIRSIKLRLDALRDVAGFRLSHSLYLRVLRDQKEA